MKSPILPPWQPLVLALCSFALWSDGAEAVFQETFGENGSAAVTDGWQNVLQRGQPSLKMLESGESSIRVNNHVLGHVLPDPLKENFQLEVEALHGSDGAFLWFGLFDSLLEKGYVVGWAIQPADQGNPDGKLTLRKVQLEAGDKPEILLKNATGTAQSQVLGDEVRSPRNALAEPPPKFKLSWSKVDGELVLECDGAEVARVADSSFSEFDSVLISGNKDTVYRSVAVSGK
jgi:hypothetical protein